MENILLLGSRFERPLQWKLIGAVTDFFVRDTYFSDPALSDVDRFAFTWAAYNAGPTKVRKMRARAAQMNLDPNRWFQNTEYAALRMVGQETVTYVSNIYKYYIAYALSREILTKKTEELQAVQDVGTK